MIVESGLIDKWQQVHWPVSHCRGQGTFSEFKSASLQGFTTVFALLATGIGLAFMVLFCEFAKKMRDG